MKGNQNANPAGPASWASSAQSLRSAKKCSTSICVRLYRALPKSARRWTLRIFRALFSVRVSAVVAVVCLAAMWWHNFSIDNTLDAQSAVGFDKQPYFRVFYHKVARTATIPEAVALTKGGVK